MVKMNEKISVSPISSNPGSGNSGKVFARMGACDCSAHFATGDQIGAENSAHGEIYQPDQSEAALVGSAIYVETEMKEKVLND